MAKRLLELSTAFDRPLVAIDGIDYEIMQRGDLGIIDQVRIWTMYGRVAQIRAKALEELTDTDNTVLGDALDTVIRIVMPDLPAAVRGRLREEQKLQILESFYAAEGGTATPPPPESWPTMETSSPA